jgi:hypothetical protein
MHPLLYCCATSRLIVLDTAPHAHAADGVLLSDESEEHHSGLVADFFSKDSCDFTNL